MRRPGDLSSRQLVRTRRRLWAEQKSRCGKCARLTRLQDMELHHRKMLRDGGTNDPGNLILWCKPCHTEETRFQNTSAEIRDEARRWRQFLTGERA